MEPRHAAAAIAGVLILAAEFPKGADTRSLDARVTRLHVEAGPDVDAEFARLAEEEERATTASP